MWSFAESEVRVGLIGNVEWASAQVHEQHVAVHMGDMTREGCTGEWQHACRFGSGYGNGNGDEFALYQRNRIGNQNAHTRACAW